MNLTGFLSRLFAICFFLSPAFAGGAVQKIAPDLYAYVSDNDASSNSTFLVTSQGILVVDTGVNALEGRKLLAEIRRISTAPVLYIVNTHYHPDHRGANSVVGPEATVISTGLHPRPPGRRKIPQLGRRRLSGDHRQSDALLRRT